MHYDIQNILFYSKKIGVIDFDEFLDGLKVYSRGTMEEKMKMLFKMYDMADNQLIDREELSTMLMSLLAPTTLIEPHAPRVQKFTQESVHKIVEEAFEKCDVDRNGKLSFAEFADWITKNPDVSEKLEEALIIHTWQPMIHVEDKDKERQSFMHRVPSWNDMKSRFHLASFSSSDLRQNKNKLKCPSCKWQPRFCTECGHKLVQDQDILECCKFYAMILRSTQIVLATCSHKVGSIRFCSSCGYEIDKKSDKDGAIKPKVPERRNSFAHIPNQQRNLISLCFLFRS